MRKLFKISCRVVVVLCLLMGLFFSMRLPVHAAAFKLNKTSISGYAGSYYQLKPLNTGGKTVKYSSTSKSICTVTSKGKVKFLTPGGTAKIKAVCRGKTFYTKVTVKGISVSITDQQTKQKISGSTISGKLGNKYQLTVSHKGAKTATFSSGNTSICSVSSKGLITLKKAGSTKVTVKCGKSSKSITVKASGWTLNVPQANLYVNEKEALTVTSLAANESVTWTSSNPAVAVIKSQYKSGTTGYCNITGLAAGTTTLTCVVAPNNKKLTTTITVYPSNETQTVKVFANNVGVSNAVDLSQFIALKPEDSLSQVKYEIYLPGSKGHPSLGTLAGSVYTANQCNIIEEGTSTNWVIASCGSYRKKFTIQAVRWMAHRGLSAEYPENTVLAFTEAAKAGAYAIETDVQATADGKFICFHNGKLSGATGKVGAGYPWKYNREKILTNFRYSEEYLRTGALVSERSFTEDELKICTLEEFLDICRTYQVWPHLEIKHLYSPNFTMDELAANLVQILADYGFTGNTCSFSAGKNARLVALSKASNYTLPIRTAKEDPDSACAADEMTAITEYMAQPDYIQPEDLPNRFTVSIASVSSDDNYIARSMQ